VTYERAVTDVESRRECLISASCMNEACERFDHRTKRREYADEVVTRAPRPFRDAPLGVPFD
jgi:hypothetical protein